MHLFLPLLGTVTVTAKMKVVVPATALFRAVSATSLVHASEGEL